MPRISVLMPCFNVAKTLSETMDSLFAQTEPDFEIVAVDDGSTDSTLAMLEGYALKDARLRVGGRDHAGIIPALNAGLAACEANYVARMDADDLAHPERLARQADFLDAHPETGVVACLVEGFPESELREGFRIYINWLNSLVHDEDIRRDRFVESPLAHPSAMFRKDIVLGIGGYQEHGWAEDYDLWLRLMEAGVAFAKVPDMLLSWRDHPTRLTRSDDRYSVKNFLRAKAHYLNRGPLKGRDAVFLWGAGMMGRRLSKHLLHRGAPLEAFIDIDPKKIGRTRRGKPILAADELMAWWRRYERPILLSAVSARGARPLIREQLEKLDFKEGTDWFLAA
ncbi:MAG: glycosyltransferase [Chloroflexi bacterium]|nr:glycosyltransferase [Chloroflexota bacterium]